MATERKKCYLHCLVGHTCQKNKIYAKKKVLRAIFTAGNFFQILCAKSRRSRNVHTLLPPQRDDDTLSSPQHDGQADPPLLYAPEMPRKKANRKAVTTD